MIGSFQLNLTKKNKKNEDGIEGKEVRNNIFEEDENQSKLENKKPKIENEKQIKKSEEFEKEGEKNIIKK